MDAPEAYTAATTAEVLDGPGSADSSAADEHKLSTTDSEQNKLLLAGMSLPAAKIYPTTYAEMQGYLQGIHNSKFDDICSYATKCISTPGEPAQDQAAQFTYDNDHDIRAHANALLRETDSRAAHSYPGRHVPTLIKIQYPSEEWVSIYGSVENIDYSLLPQSETVNLQDSVPIQRNESAVQISLKTQSLLPQSNAVDVKDIVPSKECKSAAQNDLPDKISVGNQTPKSSLNPSQPPSHKSSETTMSDINKSMKKGLADNKNTMADNKKSMEKTMADNKKSMEKTMADNKKSTDEHLGSMEKTMADNNKVQMKL